MSKPKEVTLSWSYPRRFDDLYYSEESCGKGLYQITQHLNGTSKLIYIGLVKRDGRHFYQRIGEHWDWLRRKRGIVKIRLGRIVGRQGLVQSEALIEDIESALIWYAWPEKNRSKKSYYPPVLYKELLIKNTGCYGFLTREIDTRDFQNYY